MQEASSDIEEGHGASGPPLLEFAQLADVRLPMAAEANDNRRGVFVVLSITKLGTNSCSRIDLSLLETRPDLEVGNWRRLPVGTISRNCETGFSPLVTDD